LHIIDHIKDSLYASPGSSNVYLILCHAPTAILNAILATESAMLGHCLPLLS